MPQSIHQDDSRYMLALQLAGQLIMENGGETYRVEETITRMGRAFGLTDVESFAVPSGLFVSYRHADGSAETSVRRVHKRTTNLTCVNEVNQVSRQVEAGELSYIQAYERLLTISHAPPPTSPAMTVLWAAISSGGFSVMFGGGAIEFAVAALASVAAQLLILFFEHRKLQGIITVLAGSITSALIPMLFRQLTGLCMVDATVAGVLMPLLPGLAMTIAVQDTMRGDSLSGASHGINAALTAVMVAGGALVASGIMSLLWGGGV